MATPPASAALAMSPIATLPLPKIELKTKVDAVAPHRARTVFTAVAANCPCGTTAQQKLGQNSHSTIDPIIEKRLEAASFATSIALLLPGGERHRETEAEVGAERVDADRAGRIDEPLGESRGRRRAPAIR